MRGVSSCCLWLSGTGVPGGVKAGLTRGGGTWAGRSLASFNSETVRAWCCGRVRGEAAGVKAGEAWAGKSGIIIEEAQQRRLWGIDDTEG